MAHYELDARHLLCPMPVIKLQNLSKKLEGGDTVTVIATDPGAQYDLPCWCRLNGHTLVSNTIIDSEIHITLQLIRDQL